LKVCENRVLRRIFGPKREEVAEGWRRLHNEKLHNLYTPAYISRVMNAYKVLVGIPEGKRPLARPRLRREDIRMDLRKIGWEGGDWIDLAQGREAIGGLL
jgi:hypothetical protein